MAYTWDVPEPSAAVNTAAASRLQALYLLSRARGFLPRHHDQLVVALGSLEALLDCADGDLAAAQLTGGQLQRLLDVRGACDPAAELAAMEARGIHCVGFGDLDYPELLAQVEDAPLLLYCLGDPEIMRHHGIAIVGSRKCTERGLEIAHMFGRDLAELRIPVVSGMAAGIDGAAHAGALEAGGPTVAVLGCGVDVVYPPQHHTLHADLAARGLVVSEYPPGTEPRKEHFPQRNRIISGLSKGCLVIEAPMGSGSLITARAAQDQGREVFAVPGPITSPYTKGTHYLIKKGEAKLVENVDDILAEFGTTRASLRRERTGEPARGRAGAKKSHQVPAGALLDGPLPTETATAPPAAPDVLDPAEKRLLEAISYEGTHVNELVRRLNLTTAECIAQLTMLQIRGLISSASGGYFVRL
jgi:DNA processing protein